MFKKIPTWAWIVLLIVIIVVCMRQGTEAFDFAGMGALERQIAETQAELVTIRAEAATPEQAAEWTPEGATTYPYIASTTYPGLSDDNYLNYCTSGKESGFCSDGDFATSCVNQCATQDEAASDAETTPDGCPKCVC